MDKIIPIFCGLTLLLQACPGPPLPVTNTTDWFIEGVWQWASTTTPTHSITPKTLGYSEQLSINLFTPYLRFYRNDNDTLRNSYLEAISDSGHIIQLGETDVVIKYYKPSSGYVWGSPVYLRYMALSTNQAELLIMSEFMALYSGKAETVHHYYHQPNRALPLYSY